MVAIKERGNENDHKMCGKCWQREPTEEEEMEQ